MMHRRSLNQKPTMEIRGLAGGGIGLAAGAIVGGWGAYATHKLWHWLK